MSLTTAFRRESLGPVWDKPVPDRWLCFCPNFLSFCWSSLLAFEVFTLQNFVTNQLFALEFCAVRQDTFYILQDYEQGNFYKKSSLNFIGWSLRKWKIAAYLQLAKNWNISTKVWQNLLFYHDSQPLYDDMQKEIENLDFVQGENFEFIDSLKNNCAKYSLIFDDSREEIWNSKAFVDIATAGRHRGLSTVYIKHNLVHQSKLGRCWVTKHSHCSLQVSSWCNASNYP